MRALLIDPKSCSVTEVEHDGTLQGIYKLLGCDMIEAAVHNFPRHTLYVDEEGLFKSGNLAFDISGAQQHYVGRGLLLGFNPNSGEDKACTLDLEAVKAAVRYPKLQVR